MIIITLMVMVIIYTALYPLTIAVIETEDY